MVIYKIILLIINLCLFSTKIQERCKIPDAFCRGNWGNANIWVSLQKYIIAAALCWCLQETQMWTMGVKRKRAFPYLWHPGMDNAHLWTLPLFFTPVKFSCYGCDIIAVAKKGPHRHANTWLAKYSKPLLWKFLLGHILHRLTRWRHYKPTLSQLLTML